MLTSFSFIKFLVESCFLFSECPSLLKYWELLQIDDKLNFQHVIYTIDSMRTKESDIDQIFSDISEILSSKHFLRSRVALVLMKSDSPRVSEVMHMLGEQLSQLLPQHLNKRAQIFDCASRTGNGISDVLSWLAGSGGGSYIKHKVGDEVIGVHNDERKGIKWRGLNFNEQILAFRKMKDITKQEISLKIEEGDSTENDGDAIQSDSSALPTVESKQSNLSHNYIKNLRISSISTTDEDLFNSCNVPANYSLRSPLLHDDNINIDNFNNANHFSLPFENYSTKPKYIQNKLQPTNEADSTADLIEALKVWQEAQQLHKDTQKINSRITNQHSSTENETDFIETSFQKVGKTEKNTQLHVTTYGKNENISIKKQDEQRMNISDLSKNNLLTNANDQLIGDPFLLLKQPKSNQILSRIFGGISISELAKIGGLQTNDTKLDKHNMILDQYPENVSSSNPELKARIDFLL